MVKDMEHTQNDCIDIFSEDFKTVHRNNGLVWTDGKAVYLSPISLFNNQLEQQEHYKLGEFDRGVWSVHWSENISRRDLCFLCVVHDRNISLWRVDGQQPKLSFKQIRKINIQPIPQGCLWSPGTDMLCILCAHQSSLYYNHQTNKGSQVLLQLDRDKIHCGCWVTKDTLVICVSTTLMVFKWSDIEKSLNQFTVVNWTVPGLVGRISSIAPVSNTGVVIAAELPLESLCTQQDTFVLPDLVNSNTNQSHIQHQESDIIRPNGKEASFKNILFNLQRNHQVDEEDVCKLIYIKLQNDSEIHVVSSCQVTGLLTPDVLLYHASQNVAVVGSNTQSMLQVFRIEQDTVVKTGEITLDKDERPKGISCFQNGADSDGILVLVGRATTSDAAFPSATYLINMKAALKFFPITQKSHTSLSSNSTNIQFMTMSSNIETRDCINNSIKKPDHDPQSIMLLDKSHDDKSSINILEIMQTSNKDSSELPVRPVRRKKSVRGRETMSQTSSDAGNSMSDHVGKMSMECTHDSPEYRSRDLVLVNQKPISNISGEMLPDKTDTQSDVTKNDSNFQSLETFHTARDIDLKRNGHTVQASSQMSAPSTSINTSSVETGGGGDHCNESKVKTVDFDEKNNEFNNRNPDEWCKEYEEDNQLMENVINRLENNFTITQKFDQVKSSPHSFDDKEQLRTMFTESDQHGNQVKGNTEIILSHEKPCSESSNFTDGGSLESLDDIDRMLQSQNKTILQLQDQISSLKRYVDESNCVLPTRYQSITKPDVIQMCFLSKEGIEIKKKFLLDNGRLKFDQVKQAFSLSTLELLIDGDWCVTGSNIDGYIPLRFDCNETVYINGNH